eukprot:CAMPEP_0197864456 /NCGR_PEP_ID=MMETSP1438-20131217/42713_1 /TAXON_ID=1461541 /ORGANISM="Pterosperma sp., Strain CCMP1384" /LENGTH=335 /DNA_ID=CAMNT_0043482709 /DNA_START=164 /DNA_END=1171 /DNA_ORIENTATION=-
MQYLAARLCFLAMALIVLSTEVHSELDGTFLCAQANQGSLDRITKALRAGVDPNLRCDPDFANRTPLHRSALTGNYMAVQAILAFGGNPNLKDRSGRTPLHLSAQVGDLQGLKSQIEDYDADITIEEGDHRTVFAEAVKFDRYLVAQYLLEVQEMDADAPDKYGQTPLMFATANKNLEMVQLLLEAEVDVNHPNKASQTALLTAVTEDAPTDIVTTLINFGADVDFPGLEGLSPLMAAARWGTIPETITELIKAGADVNRQDTDGRTALMFAAYAGNLDALYILLDSGANWDVVNYNDMTAMEVAFATEHYEIVTAIKNYGEKRERQQEIAGREL